MILFFFSYFVRLNKKKDTLASKVSQTQVIVVVSLSLCVLFRSKKKNKKKRHLHCAIERCNDCRIFAYINRGLNKFLQANGSCVGRKEFRSLQNVTNQHSTMETMVLGNVHWKVM